MPALELQCRGVALPVRGFTCRHLQAHGLRTAKTIGVPSLISGRNFQRHLPCRAQSDDVQVSGPVPFLLNYASSLGINKEITQTQAYSVWLQGAVVLVILAAIDAAYSGDWSRIGVIPKEVELGLRPLLALLGFFHIFCGGIAFVAASRKGYNPVPATAKVLAVGFLALVEVLLKEPASGSNA